eukprot:jgi/Chrzof1/11426/Cz05g36090.t1
MLKQVRVSQGALASALNRRIGTGDRALSVETQNPEPRTQGDAANKVGTYTAWNRCLLRNVQLAHDWYGCYEPIHIPDLTSLPGTGAYLVQACNK